MLLWNVWMIITQQTICPNNFWLADNALSAPCGMVTHRQTSQQNTSSNIMKHRKVTQHWHSPLVSRLEFLKVTWSSSEESDICWQGKLYIAVISPSLSPMVVLRAWMFVPVLQGHHQVTMWVSKWEKGRSNIKTYGDNCQQWQHECFQDRSWLLDVVEADSQSSVHPRGLLFLGHGCGQAPGELQECSSLGRVWGVDAVIPGSLEEVDTMDPGSLYKAQGRIWMEHSSSRATNLCNTAQAL